MDYETKWFSGRFVYTDNKTKKVKIHFLYRSAIYDNCFTWPELSTDRNKDKKWSGNKEG